MYLEIRASLLNKIVQRKRDSSIIYDEYIRQKEIPLNTVTPKNINDTIKVKSEDDFTVADIKNPLMLWTIDNKASDSKERSKTRKEFESLSHSDLVCTNRPRSTKYEYSKGRTWNLSQVGLDSQKCNVFTPFMSINLRMKYIKNSNSKHKHRKGSNK